MMNTGFYAKREDEVQMTFVHRDCEHRRHRPDRQKSVTSTSTSRPSHLTAIHNMSSRTAFAALRTAARCSQTSRLRAHSSIAATTDAPARAFSSTCLRRSALNNILASEDDPVKLQVDRLTPRGFHLTDDLLVPGGLLLIDGQPFLWDVNPPNLKAANLIEFWRGWSPEAFKVFEVVLPRPGMWSPLFNSPTDREMREIRMLTPEMLIFGTGESVVPPPKEIKEYISGLGIQLDVQSSVRDDP